MSIKATQVSLSRGNRWLLNDIQLEIDCGQILGVIGPNGSGKTMLLNLLAGDFPVSSGAIYYENLLINDYTLIDRAKYRSVMSQRQEIVFSYTVKEIVEMGIVGEYGVYKDTHTSDRLQNIIELLQLEELKDRNVRTLSGGEQQRVHIARALIQIWQEKFYSDPRFLLLDEPTSSLDLAHEIQVLEILRAEVKKGLGVMIVFHDLNLTAHFADKVALISGGKIAAYGTPEQVLQPEILSNIYGLAMTVSKKPLRVSYF